MAEERAMISVPKSTDNLVEKLAEKLDETKGKIVKKAVDAMARKENVK